MRVSLPTFPHRLLRCNCVRRFGGAAALLLAAGSCSSSEEAPPPTTNIPVKPAPTTGTNSPAAAAGTGAGTTLVNAEPTTGNPESPAPTAGTPTTPANPTPTSGALPTPPTANPTAQPSTGSTDVGVVIEDDDGTILETTPPVNPTTNLPLNLGSEVACDDVDDNNNGIIDDVDVGKDGLCDCIHIGFFGEISSDAGEDTASFDAWLIERSGEVPIKHLAADEPLTAEWLASLQVLIIGGMQDRAASGGHFTPEEVAAFDDWLQNRGGGAITLSGYTASADDARPTNELLANTGLSYDLGTVEEQGVIGEAAPPVWLDGIEAPEHPTVDQVGEIGVFYGYPVKGDGTVILEGEGYDLAMAKVVGNGRVFIFADEWITQDATWAGLSNGQSDPCQQPCNEQSNICRIATEQCAQCELQPCSDPNETDAGTCMKGCQPSCESETARCETNTQLCAACTVDADARAEATPRLWLNTIRWLTPVNECKVDIPPSVRVR